MTGSSIAKNRSTAICVEVYPRDRANSLNGMFHTRRMFGGGLAQAWPFAAVALHYLSGFGERYARAVRTAHDLTTALRKHGAFTVEPIPRGTNLFRLKMRTTDAGARFRNGSRRVG